jgi:Zn-finger protein
MPGYLGNFFMEPKDAVKTENFKFFENKDCEFYPCHDKQSINCLFCYCPLVWLECPGKYTVIESPPGVKRKDCSECTLTHGKMGWEVVQKWVRIPKLWSPDDE